MVATTNTKSPWRPRKRSLAKANPASAEVSTTATVATEATRRVFSSARPNWTSSLAKTRSMLPASWSPGSSGGGTLRISLLAREAITSMKYSGAIDSSTTRVSVTYIRGEAPEARVEVLISVRRSDPAQQDQVDRRGDGDDDEQHPGDRGRVAEAVAGEPLLHEVHRDGLELAAVASGDRVRPAVEQQRLGEQLDAADRGDDRHEDQRGPQHRQRDRPELPPGRGTVDPRR